MSNTETTPLKGKSAFISGSCGLGIGTHAALKLARLGARVFLNGLNEYNDTAVAALFHEKKLSFEIVHGDISQVTQAKKIIQTILTKVNSIDIFVSNAARGGDNKRIDLLSDAEWFDELNIILNGAFYCLREIIPGMISNNGGKIIFMSSSAATTGSWGRNASYAAAKAGLIGLTKRLALELAEYKINVNCIAPSQVLTPRVLKNGRKTPEGILEHSRKNVPLGRPASPEDVANLAAFLATEESSYFTGQVFSLDGGASLAKKDFSVPT